MEKPKPGELAARARRKLARKIVGEQVLRIPVKNPERPCKTEDELMGQLPLWEDD